MSAVETELDAWWKEGLLKSINFDSDELPALAEFMSALVAIDLSNCVQHAMADWLFKIEKLCFSEGRALDKLLQVAALLIRKHLVGLEEWDDLNT